ncbi:MAG: hypothetical protein HC904_11915 [Blastochloris sp.]|nr:hypothetical protein [Blastochloris sp.]
MRQLLFFLLLFWLGWNQDLEAATSSREEMRRPNRVQPAPEPAPSSEGPPASVPAPVREVEPAAPQPVAPVATPRAELGEDTRPGPLKVGEGTLLTYYGHAFVYLTSKSGVRIAINPYAEGTVPYTFPKSLAADIVLISSEAGDHSGGQNFLEFRKFSEA